MTELKLTVSSDFREEDIDTIREIILLMTPTKMYDILVDLDYVTLKSLQAAIDVSLEDVYKENK